MSINVLLSFFLSSSQKNRPKFKQCSQRQRNPHIQIQSWHSGCQKTLKGEDNQLTLHEDGDVDEGRSERVVSVASIDPFVALRQVPEEDGNVVLPFNRLQRAVRPLAGPAQERGDAVDGRAEQLDASTWDENQFSKVAHSLEGLPNRRERFLTR